MKRRFAHAIEKCRVRNTGTPWDSENGDHFGFFVDVMCPLRAVAFNVMISDGEGWEHVSISNSYYTPLWEEMCWFKDRFFHENERVVQFHPPKEEQVNNHDHCLHLWKLTDGEFPHPPSIMVGLKDLGTLK